MTLGLQPGIENRGRASPHSVSRELILSGKWVRGPLGPQLHLEENVDKFLCTEYLQPLQGSGCWVIATCGSSVTLGRLSHYSGPQGPHL